MMNNAADVNVNGRWWHFEYELLVKRKRVREEDTDQELKISDCNRIGEYGCHKVTLFEEMTCRAFRSSLFDWGGRNEETRQLEELKPSGSYLNK